jgi:hypothetical protein
MNDNVSAANGDGGVGQVTTLLQVIVGLLVVIAIVLLVILARGPEDQERSGASLPVAAALITA